ncbi:MAG: protein translocase subunit SecF [Eubacteriales bacterium]|nr:protein translocase subunit SecF [Eubacteriales bacterium]
MKNINVTANKGKFLLLPLLVVLVGVIMFFVNSNTKDSGFNYDIEFMGGVRMQVEMEKAFDNEEVSDFLEEKLGISPVIVQAGSGTTATIKTQPIDDAQKDLIFSSLKEKYALTSEAPMSVNSASASFGKEVQGKAFMYTLIAILLILVYIAFRFEWRSAVMAVLALALNILVMMAVYAITYTPLNTTFIAAMLTIVGYSINNTIVVFDRIRENMRGFKAKKGGAKVSDVVNRSINESMGRTLNTTITTLITVVLLYILGVPSIKEFAFPLIIGVIAGAYSSIFIASPFWAAWKEAEAEEAAKR